ncbi:MAG: ATPase [Deltaproteobacteria bacterium]|nr:ATPase [Deltaproteobacteria bacterium]
MAQRPIREYHTKRMLAEHWKFYFGGLTPYEARMVLVCPDTDLEEVVREHGWLTGSRLVVKPDQLFGKRGKNRLILVDGSVEQGLDWIRERMNREITVGGIADTLTHFLMEEFVPHDGEFYVAIQSDREEDRILFSPHGGVEIEDLWDTVKTVSVSVGDDLDIDVLTGSLSECLPGEDIPEVRQFVAGLYRFFRDLHFTYLEINPFAVTKDSVKPLDAVARLDDTAHFKCVEKWGDIDFPAPFGLHLSSEEAYIKDLDKKSGASLKLTVFNPEARVWTLIAGGGASVIYADTIVDLGFGRDLANYGEYSGNPSTDETYEYVKTILGLMCTHPDPRGKILIIGGGIANFTDVNSTFTGMIKALEDFGTQFRDHKVSIYVRRGGPNYKEGLENLRGAVENLGIPIRVYGPELHMTKIVTTALADNGGN